VSALKVTGKVLKPRVLALLEDNPDGITNGDIRHILEKEDAAPACPDYMRAVDGALVQLKNAGVAMNLRVNGFPRWFKTAK
jgi:hypothetical protein